MKSYITVDDALGTAVEFHRNTADWYRSRSEKTDDERVRLALQQLEEREKQAAEDLEAYRDEAGSAARWLDRWLQFGPDENRLQRPDSPDDGESLEKVETAAGEINRQLTDYFSAAAARVEEEPVRELFARLAEKQQREASVHVRNALESAQDL